MPVGYIHITRLEARTGTVGNEMPVYQVNYVLPGISYGIALDEGDLSGFLLDKVPLDEDELDVVMNRLHQVGHANIGDVELPPEETSALGMQQIEDDF